MMDKEIFKREKHTMYLYGGIYAAICELLSLVAIGGNIGFAAGLAVGILTVMVNFNLLEKVIDCVTINKNPIVGGLIHMTRLLLFGITAFLCYKISLYSVIGYSIGIVGLTVVTLFYYWKGGKA